MALYDEALGLQAFLGEKIYFQGKQLCHFLPTEAVQVSYNSNMNDLGATHNGKLVCKPLTTSGGPI